MTRTSRLGKPINVKAFDPLSENHLLGILISTVLIVSFEGDKYCGNGFEAKVLKDSEGLRENADVKSALRI